MMTKEKFCKMIQDVSNDLLPDVCYQLDITIPEIEIDVSNKEINDDNLLLACTRLYVIKDSNNIIKKLGCRRVTVFVLNQIDIAIDGFSENFGFSEVITDIALFINYMYTLLHELYHMYLYGIESMYRDVKLEDINFKDYMIEIRCDEFAYDYIYEKFTSDIYKLILNVLHATSMYSVVTQEDIKEEFSEIVKKGLPEIKYIDDNKYIIPIFHI